MRVKISVEFRTRMPKPRECSMIFSCLDLNLLVSCGSRARKHQIWITQGTSSKHPFQHPSIACATARSSPTPWPGMLSLSCCPLLKFTCAPRRGWPCWTALDAGPGPNKLMFTEKQIRLVMSNFWTTTILGNVCGQLLCSIIVFTCFHSLVRRFWAGAQLEHDYVYLAQDRDEWNSSSHGCNNPKPLQKQNYSNKALGIQRCFATPADTMAPHNSPDFTQCKHSTDMAGHK